MAFCNRTAEVAVRANRVQIQVCKSKGLRRVKLGRRLEVRKCYLFNKITQCLQV